MAVVPGSSSTSPLEAALTWLQANPGVVLAAAVALLFQILLLIQKLSKNTQPWLDPENYKPLPLTQKEQITHNVVRLRFALPSKNQRLGLPIGKHISFLAKGADGKDVYRSYTPTSDDDLLGAVEFVIKLYPQGQMSQIINKLQVGETMLMRGPKGLFQYKPNMKAHIGMLAGGTGVTPMYQVVQAILKNPADRTKVSLVFGNLTEDDILLRVELEALARQHPERFKVYHVLNSPPEGWSGGAGFITQEVIQQRLAPPGPSVMVLQCGPKPMTDAMTQHLDALGYDEQSKFRF